MSCTIYGKEEAEFSLSIIDLDDSIVENGIDWILEDSNLDGSDSSSIHNNVDKSFNPTKIFNSPGQKKVKSDISFNDGWDNIYINHSEILVSPIPYDAPILDFSWTPVEPTIIDTVVFTQNHNDTRSIDGVDTKGKIETSTLNYYDDETIDVEGLFDTDTTDYVFTSKEDGIRIRLTSTYWDGWEFKSTDILKILNMSNIPPVSDHIREDAGQCIPAYIWTATSTDMDDDDLTLTYEWKLYKEVDLSFIEISTGTDKEYTYPFQYEGNYRISLKTTDAEGDWSEKIEDFPIVFDVCGTGTGTGSSGIVRLESDRFEMISIPVRGRTVNDYFIQKLEEVTGKAAIESIDFVKAYPSNTLSSGKYIGFVPGVTNPDSSYNFKLVEDDDGVEAHVPFFVRTKVLDATIEISWTTEDEVV